MENQSEVVSFKYLEKEYGYKRYKCKVCGGFFWSRVPRDTCPDRPCSRYEFLYKNYAKVSPLNLSDVRRRFIEYLVKRGHGVVDPYPVVAKWRNDLYLTIASIVVFQPLVTEGLIDPPHNPLVIVQPSIRLTDIDNVGLTFGRHLSSFEMGGMHAFNKPGKIIYWSEGIFENTIGFFTEAIGLEIDDLVFKEGWWEGGGNAGPAPEVLVDGIEVATLVHMAYKVVNGRYELNPLLVVDCGYGIERITWLTKRTPTGFHAIYGDLVEKYKNILGVEEPPEDVLKRAVYVLSNIEYRSVEEYAQLLEKTGFKDYMRRLVSAVYLYSVLDHVRTLSLMLSDGVVPSNTSEGYLARLVLRRLLRSLLKLGVKHSELRDIVVKLVEEQIKYWRGDYIYGKLERHRDYVVNVVEVETEKFINSLIRGLEIVERFVKKKRVFTTEDLVEIYDSHGIPPDIIAEKLAQYNIRVEIPPDFYSIVASRHSSPTQLIKEKEYEFPQLIVEWALKYPETRRVFHEDPYLVKLKTRVLGVRDNYVVLESTIAYPWGGGQEHDEGFIKYGGEVYKITYVGKVGDVIIHVLEKTPVFKPGDEVELEINWERRYKLMRHHTATHIILAAARSVLGDHVWQAGAEKTTSKARLDITHHKPLSEEEVEKIEKLANEIINNRIPVKFNYLDRFTAESRYGVRIYQGGAVYTPILRIVEIPGVDAQACFGTHLTNTSEVGGVKIIGVERIQDGVVRLEFIAGTRLVEHLRELEAEKKRILEIIGVKHGELFTSIKKLYEDYKRALSVIEDYRGVLEKVLLEKALAEKIPLCGVNSTYIELPIKDEKLAKSLIEELSLKKKLLVVLVMGDMLEAAISPELSEQLKIDLRKLVETLTPLGVRGGGKPDHITAKLTSKISPEKILETLRELSCKNKAN
ncbi:MAG: alanine--tRNA ligase [Desulfurococcaceae archaeon]|nr:alanine--tRNA ligase [Desulfurococcaceae archaeon]